MPSSDQGIAGASIERNFYFAPSCDFEKSNCEAHLLWEQGVPGSIPGAPTNSYL